MSFVRSLGKLSTLDRLSRMMITLFQQNFASVDALDFSDCPTPAAIKDRIIRSAPQST
jgi:hypothetical protein